MDTPEWLEDHYFFTCMAQREGLTPEEFYEKYGIEDPLKPFKEYAERNNNGGQELQVHEEVRPRQHKESQP